MKSKIVNMYSYQVNDMIYIGTWKRTAMKALFFFVLMLLALVITVVPQIVSKKQVRHRLARYPTDLKYILVWTEPKKQHNKTTFFKNFEPDFLPGQTMFIQQKCPQYNCYLTYDRKTLNHDEDFDAVIFNVFDVKRMDFEKFNLTRDPDQLYIFKSFEVADKYNLCDKNLDDFFNVTWTYKLNSDLPQPLYRVYNESNALVGPKIGMQWIQKMKHKGQFSATVRTKAKAIAWIVTKCKQKSKHQEFITELRNELKGYNYTVDEFGRCGQHKCPNVAKCSKLIEKKYFFQLIFEDYFSDDYVTDKIVSAMAHVTIPIVLGAGDYRNFLPPGSYINAQSFDLKKLGALIDYLMKNRDMYEYFFDWKNHYYFKDVPVTPVCQLCEKLNTERQFRSYKHFRYWWNPDFKDLCQRIRLYKMFNNNDM